MSFRISKWQSRKLDSGKAVSGNIREDDSEQNPDITQLKDDEEELKVGWFRSVISVFTTSPYDWYLSLNEDIAVIDWDAKSNTIAWPLGNILTFSFFAIRLLQDNLITPNIYKFNHSQDAFDFSKSSNLKKYEYFQKYQNNNGGSNEFYYRMLGYLHQLFSILTILLFLANLTITYRYLFAHYQTYSIFYWKSIPRSKNVVKRSLHDLNHKYIEDAERDSLWGMLKYLLFNKSNSDDISHQEHYYELRKWTPSRFLTCLFISFSPICFCFLWAIRVSFKTLIPVVIHQYVLWFLVIDRYEQRVKDEQILAMANLAEINAKIIQPKASALKQDAMVDATPYNNSTVYFYPAYTTTRSHVFETHTLTGDLIKEKYNPQTKMFEDTIPGRSNNYVRFSRELKGINGGSMRQPFLSRQTSPRLSPVRYADSYGEKSPSAPSTPMVIPSQQPQFIQQIMGNHVSRNNSRNFQPNGMNASRRYSQSPVKNYSTNRLLQNVDDTTYSVDDVADDRYRLEERARRERMSASPVRPVEINVDYDNDGDRIPSRSTIRNSSRSPFR